MAKPVNAWQETVHRLIHTQRVNAKRIAFTLHRASDYLSDICRRERVDPFAVCNAILKEAERRDLGDVPRFIETCNPIIGLLFDGTHWMATFVPDSDTAPTAYTKLCEQAGILCEDLGGTIKALAKIEADGAYDEKDDPQISECHLKAGLLIERLKALQVELHHRRTARAHL